MTVQHDPNEELTVETIKAKAAKIFFPQGKSRKCNLKLSSMKLELGNFAEEKIKDFTDSEGNKCTYEQYLKTNGLYSSWNILYLMTTGVSDPDGPSSFKES